jgi:hypothetical protein
MTWQSDSNYQYTYHTITGNLESLCFKRWQDCKVYLRHGTIKTGLTNSTKKLHIFWVQFVIWINNQKIPSSSFSLGKRVNNSSPKKEPSVPWNVQQALKTKLRARTCGENVLKFISHNISRTFWLAEQLLHSHEGFCYT